MLGRSIDIEGVGLTTDQGQGPGVGPVEQEVVPPSRRLNADVRGSQPNHQHQSTERRKQRPAMH